MIITIEIPNNLKQRVLNSFAASRGYQETVIASNSVDMIPNPESKSEFMARLLVETIMRDIKNHEGNSAADTARNNACQNVEGEVIIVSAVSNA